MQKKAQSREEERKVSQPIHRDFFLTRRTPGRTEYNEPLFNNTLSPEPNQLFGHGWEL